MQEKTGSKGSLGCKLWPLDKRVELDNDQPREQLHSA